MQIAALLFLVAAASATPFDPEGSFWSDSMDAFTDTPTDPYIDNPTGVPQFGWFKGDVTDMNGNPNMGAMGPLQPDAGAGPDDTYSSRETTSITGFVQDHLADAAHFLSDQNADSFDFQQWYQGELENFETDQQDVEYTNTQDKEKDLEDFQDQLNQIATQFQEAQNNDYSSYVSDTVNDVWGQAIDQSEQIIGQLKDTGFQLNEYEYQAAQIYNELIAIGCGQNGGDSYLPSPGSYSDQHQTMLQLVDVTGDIDTGGETGATEFDLSTYEEPSGTAKFFGEDQSSPYQCEMSQIFWQFVELNDELNGGGMYAGNMGHVTLARQQDILGQKNQLVRAFNQARQQWRQLRYQLQQVEQQSDHERQEITQLNTVLANLLTVDSNYQGPLGGVAIYDGAQAARPRKLDGSWDPYTSVGTDWNTLYGGGQTYPPNYGGPYPVGYPGPTYPV